MCICLNRVTLNLFGRLFRSLILGTTAMSIPPMCHCKRGDENPNWEGHTLSSTIEYNTGEITKKLCLKKQTIQQACKFMWSLKRSNHEQINLHQRFTAGRLKSNQMWRSWAARQKQCFLMKQLLQSTRPKPAYGWLLLTGGSKWPPLVQNVIVTHRVVQLTSFGAKTWPSLTGGSNWPFRCLNYPNFKNTIAIRFRMRLSPVEDITRTLKAFLSGRTKFAIPLSRK